MGVLDLREAGTRRWSQALAAAAVACLIPGCGSSKETSSGISSQEARPRTLDAQARAESERLVEENAPGDGAAYRYETPLHRLFPNNERRGIFTAASLVYASKCYEDAGISVPEFDVDGFLAETDRVADAEFRNAAASRFYDKDPRATTVAEAKDLLEARPVNEFVFKWESGFEVPDSVGDRCLEETNRRLAEGSGKATATADSTATELMGLAQTRAEGTPEVQAAGDRFAQCMGEAGFEKAAPPDRESLPASDSELRQYWDCLDSSEFSVTYAEQTAIQDLVIIDENREQILEMRAQRVKSFEVADEILAES